MTPDLEPLLCSCGKHSARLQPPGCKKPKWQVFSVKKTGNKPQVVTSRAKKEDALCVVRDLCAGVYEKQNQPRAAAAVPEARSRPVRKRKQLDEATAPATAATKPAGPGRGHKQLVREGMFVGGECTNETEPYIIAIALSGPMVWRGEAGSCWLGKITEGAYLCFLCF